MKKSCLACGAPIPARNKYCDNTCRQAGHRARTRMRVEVFGEDQARQLGGSTERAVREKLADAECDEWEKQICYSLAVRLDHPVGETGSSIASVGKALRLQMAAILTPATTPNADKPKDEEDILDGIEDEIGARRNRRRA